MRELAGGTDQHIDWVDMLPESVIYANTRDADFTSRLFTWSGVPHPVFGDSAPVATGRDVFQGHSESVSIKFPAVTAGQPVPPPYYTAVARIRDGNGNTLTEARKRIFVPQVVCLTYDASAVSALKPSIINTISGITHVFFNGFTDSDWYAVWGNLPAMIQNYYDGAGANVRIVNSLVGLSMPYTRLHFTQGIIGGGALGGATSTDFLNLDPEDWAGVYVGNIHDAINKVAFGDNPAQIDIPVTTSHIGHGMAKVAAHELGHLLGLVHVGNYLDGDTDEPNHNKPPYTARRIMNPGGGFRLAR